MGKGISVEQALQNRKSRVEEERRSSVEQALDDRKKRISSEMSSIGKDLMDRYNTSVANYNSYAESYAPKYGMDIAEELGRQRDISLSNKQLISDVEAYRSYIGDEKADAMLDNLRKISEGYKYSLDNFDYFQKMDYDLDAGKADIDGLNSAIEEYDGLRKSTPIVSRASSDGDKQLEKIRNNTERQQEILSSYGYESYSDMMDDYAKKSAYYNQAKLLQGRAKISNDALSAPDFREYADKGASIENPSMNDAEGWLVIGGGLWSEDNDGLHIGGKKVGNIVTYSRENADAIQMGGAGMVGDEKYRHMTNDEVDIFNYYLAKEKEGLVEKGSAQKYLDSIEDALNQRSAGQRASTMEDKPALELLFGVEAGLDQFRSGISNLFNTDDDYISPTKTQYTSALVREDLADVGGQFLGSSIGQGAYDLITTTTNMMPSILASTVVGTLNPMAGTAVGAGLMGGSAAGNAYQEMLNAGYDKDQARVYSALAGASEAGLQYALGGIGKLGGKLSGKSINAIASGINNAGLRFAVKFGGEMASEGVEEFMQDVLDPYFKSIATGEIPENVDWEQAFYSGMLGALSAGVLNGVNAGINKNAEVSEAKRIIRSGNKDALVDVGKTFDAETIAYKLADKVTPKTGAWKLSQLLHEVNANLGEQTQADIKNALVQKGMTETDAGSISKWLAKAVEGGNLTRLQQKALEENDVISSVFKEVVLDRNSTVNQRLQGMMNYRGIDGTSGIDFEAIEEGTTKENLSKQATSHMAMKKASEEAVARMLGIGQTRSKNDVSGLDKIASDIARHSNSLGGMKTKSTIDSVKESIASDRKVSAEEGTSVKKIQSIKDGKMMLELTDGSVVDSKDVVYNSDDQALLYESVLSMGYSAESANAIVNGYSALSGISASQYLLGVNEAYNYGKIGYPLSSIKTDGFISDLTDTQKSFAYGLGRADADGSTKSAQNFVNRKKTDAKRKGRVVLSASVSNMTDIQKASISAIGRVVADVTHNNVVIYESVAKDGRRVFSKDIAGHKAGESAPNGFYDPNTGAIYIDINAGNNGEGAMLWTVAHEMTHFIRQWSPEKFKVLADFLMQEYGKNGVDVQTLIENQIAKAKRAGRNLSFDAAYEEVVADSMSSMFTDTNMSEKLAKLKAQDQTLLEKMKGFFADLYNRIKEAYKGLKPQTQEAMYVKRMMDSVERISDLFAEALVDAGDTFSSADAILMENGISVDSETDSASILSARDVLDDNKRTKIINPSYGSKYSDRETEQYIAKSTKKYGDVESAAIEHFGTTDDFRVAGYILRDGQMLDFSGAHWLEGASASYIADWRKKNDIRQVDHEDVYEAFEISANDFPSDSRKEFINRGNIRVSPEAPGINIASEPTSEQYQVIRELILDNPYNVPGFYVDIENKDKRIEKLSYSGKVNADRVINDIKYYYATGSVRNQSDLMKFHASDDVKYSTREVVEIPEEKYEELKSHFGITNNFKVAGYLLKDGTMLDFSGKHWGDTTSDYRQVDHRDVNEVLDDDDNYDAMVQMIGDGNIRLMPESGGINLSVMPTTKQIGILEKYIRNFKGEVLVDFDEPGGDTVYSRNYNKGTDARTILRDIDNYFKGGKQSELMQFHTSDEDVMYSVREEEPPKKTIKGYKVFFVKDGKLYPPMVANPNGADTPVGVWLNADIGTQAPDSKTGRKQVKAGGKGTQGGSGSLAFRPGWHLGEIPLATQFDRLNPETGVKELFPENFVWAECDVAADIDYQEEAMSYGYNKNGKFQHSLAGLPKLPTDGYYRYRTNPNPDTVPWLITGAMKVNRLLSDDEVNEILAEKGIAPKQRQGGNKTLADLGLSQYEGYSYRDSYAEIANDIASLYESFNTYDYWDEMNGNEDIEIADQLRRGDTSIIDRIKEDYEEFDDNEKKIADSIIRRVEGETKYSERDDSSLDTRTLLSNALATTAQNEIESKYITQYQEKIATINAEQAKLTELRARIKELSFAPGPKNADQIRKLQEEATKIANRISTYDKQLLKLEATKPLRQVLDREKAKAKKKAEKEGREALDAYRERAARTQRELMDRYQTRIKNNKESRERTELRHKILKKVKELNDLLLNGDANHHVPLALQKYTADALSAINKDTVNAENRIAILREKIARSSDPDKIAMWEKTIDRIELQGENMREKLDALDRAYREIKDSKNPLIANAYDDGIQGMITNIKEEVGDTPLREMTKDQLEMVHDMYKAILHTIRTSNKAFKAARQESISELGSKVANQIILTGGKKKYVVKALESIKKFGWDNMKPIYAMKTLGSETLLELFNNVRAGEDTWAVDVSEAREYFLDKAKKYGYKDWDFDTRYSFVSKSGKEFSLNLQEIMSLYAYSKREQADLHLSMGGFVFEDSTVVKKVKGVPVEYKINVADAHNISFEVLQEITRRLTTEQKAFVDEMQSYMSNELSAKGNEVSIALYDIDLFREKNYFPLKSAKQYMFEKNEAAGEVRLKNSGFTKKTVRNANNPIVLRGFMDVWSGHVNDMAMYHAFVLPLEDFNRVWNYKTPTSSNLPTESVKMAIQNAYGDQANKYISQMLTDLNGGARSGTGAGIINKMTSLFKKGAVFASASVVIQQPSAIARAWSYIDPKYFAKTIASAWNPKKHKSNWEEVKKYAPIAIIKEMGYFDTNMGRQTTDWITSIEHEGRKEKLIALFKDGDYRDEVLSKAPAIADEITWSHIWNAVKEEVADTTEIPAGTDLFFDACGKRFTEVIVNTQVYDSVLSRSALMRSKDTGAKMATAFIAEPTTSINMIADALLQAKRGGDSKRARRVIGSVVAQIIINSALVSLVYAARDDDDEKTYAEKYVKSLSGSVIDGLNPLSMIPFGRDIMSIIQGYDVERSDMTVIANLYKSWQNLFKDSYSPYKKFESFVGSVANMFGIPLKNLMRDGRGIWNIVEGIMSDNKTTAEGLKYALIEGVTGDKKYDRIKENLFKSINNNDNAEASKNAKALVDYYVSKGKTEKDAKTSARTIVTKEVKDDFLKAYKSGENETMASIRRMLKATGLYEDVVKTTQDWIKNSKK